MVTPNLKMFTLAELKSETKNFRPDTVLGEGGFGTVYKGWIGEETFAPSKGGVGMPVAVKNSNPDSEQGHKEWQAEVKFLGKFSHPNLVYEYMQKGWANCLSVERSTSSLGLSCSSISCWRDFICKSWGRVVHYFLIFLHANKTTKMTLVFVPVWRGRQVVLIWAKLIDNTISPDPYFSNISFDLVFNFITNSSSSLHNFINPLILFLFQLSIIQYLFHETTPAPPQTTPLPTALQLTNVIPYSTSYSYHLSFLLD